MSKKKFLWVTDEEVLNWLREDAQKHDRSSNKHLTSIVREKKDSTVTHFDGNEIEFFELPTTPRKNGKDKE